MAGTVAFPAADCRSRSTFLSFRFSETNVQDDEGKGWCEGVTKGAKVS